jgi:ribosomal protein L24E
MTICNFCKKEVRQGEGTTLTLKYRSEEKVYSGHKKCMKYLAIAYENEAAKRSL